MLYYHCSGLEMTLFNNNHIVITNIKYCDQTRSQRFMYIISLSPYNLCETGTIIYL